MNTAKQWFLIRLLIIGFMFAIGIYFYNDLPNMMPVHWDIEGQPDKFMLKENAIILFPVITFFIAILFPIIKSIDPRKVKYEQFAKTWEIIQYILILFFAYIYFVSIYMTLNPEASINTFMLWGVWILFILLGNYMWKIRSNYFVWIKTPWTIEDEEVWNKTHRFGWWMFILWWFMMMIAAFFPAFTKLFFIWAIVMTWLFPVIYSYIIYRKKHLK